MKDNPQLRVLVLNGRCDLACPVDSIRYSIDHLRLDPAYRGRITYAEYEAGHMMYVNPPDLRKMQKDIEQFILRRAGRRAAGNGPAGGTGMLSRPSRRVAAARAASSAPAGATDFAAARQSWAATAVAAAPPPVSPAPPPTTVDRSTCRTRSVA